MSLLKPDDFIADVERQFEWQVTQAGWEVAERYLRAPLYRRNTSGKSQPP